jgi:hypothetical protein
MEIADQLRAAWNPYQDSIRSTLRVLAHAPMPDECDFLWFVLYPQDMEGFPIMVWPTERNQQQHDGWEREYDLLRSVPDTVQLPEGAGSTTESLDELRDATAEYLKEQWNAIDIPSNRLAYFSLYDDGFYFSLQDGRKISAWDIKTEIGEQAGSSNGG